MTRCVIMLSLVGLFVAPAALALSFPNRGKSIFGRGGVGGQSLRQSRTERLTPAQAAQFPTKQQVDAFLDRNPAAKARAQARAASARPVRTVTSCGCSSTTCTEESFPLTGVFDITDGVPCTIMDPKPEVHQCTEAADDIDCPDINGCGCTMGSCTNEGLTAEIVDAVCFLPGGDIFPLFEEREIIVAYFAGGCCCES